jgi:Tol biopolymer transport system component
VILWALGLADGLPLTSQVTGLDAAQTEPTTGKAVAGPVCRLPERFMVRYQGCALLGPGGQEEERLESISNGAGAISPDGRWAVFSQSEPNPLPAGEQPGRLVIQSRSHPEDRTSVPLVWGTTGSSFLPLWSSDSRRILICEQGFDEDRSRGSAYRVYDLATKGLTTLRLPEEWWPSDWSADGKRLLTSQRTANGSLRVAWVRIDGTGEPEFVTPDQEVAYGAKLSPDNRRILCMVGPRVPEDQQYRTRLYVIDLATKQRTMIDKPGHTDGYCWSSDGSKVAYTWQLPIQEPEAKVERKTYLITCDPDGSNRKTVTMRSTRCRRIVPAGGV